MLRVELKAERPGYIFFKANGWKGQSNHLEISIQENQQMRYLDGKNWNAEQVWLKVSELTIENGTLQGTLGPWFVDPLVEQSTNVQYRIIVRDDQNVKDLCALRLPSDVLSSSALGNNERAEDVRTITSQTEENIVVPIEGVSPEPEVDPEPEVVEDLVTKEDAVSQATITSTPLKQKSKMGLLIGLLILLLVIAGAVCFFLFNKSADMPKDDCSLASNGGDELAFIQTCLKTKPDTQKILAIITEAKATNHCSVAQRLYANQAQNGNAEIALAYAKEYEESANSSCFKADKNTAIYWYETALEANPNLEEAKKRLEELKK